MPRCNYWDLETGEQCSEDGAMVWTIAEWGGLTDTALSQLIWKLEGS